MFNLISYRMFSITMYVSSSAFTNQSASSKWYWCTYKKAARVLDQRAARPSTTGSLTVGRSGSDRELIKSNRLHRLPQVRFTWIAFFLWLVGLVITQHNIRTRSYNNDWSSISSLLERKSKEICSSILIYLFLLVKYKQTSFKFFLHFLQNQNWS